MKIVRFIGNDTLIFEKSNRLNKKYKVVVNDTAPIHFGDNRYEHYKDKIGMFSNLDHLNNTRRMNYLKRSKKIKNKRGQITANIKYTPNWFSINYLW